MKTIIIPIVLFIFSISPAFAELANSKHDFSAFLLTGGPCAYCHSVHNSIGGMGSSAYWGTLPDITSVYDSSSMNHNPTTVGANASDAAFCLVCHDGTFAVVNVGANISSLILNTKNDIGTLNGSPVGGGKSSLADDHPIGFVFDAFSLTLDPNLQLPTDENVHVTFGESKNQMWCSTCHNVHGGIPNTPFLSMNNEGSALCLQCHIK